MTALKEMVNATAVRTVRRVMDALGRFNTQEARVALGYHLERLLCFFRA